MYQKRKKMKILVYGAGVLGSLYAAKLTESGHDVSILARGHRLKTIRMDGIELEEFSSGRQTRTWVKVVETLTPEDCYDLVIVLMRKNQVSSILPILAANRNTPNVMFMCNNASGSGEWIKALGKDRVLLGFAGAGGLFDGHVVLHDILNGWNQATIFGELNGQITPRLKEIASVFKRAGFPVEISRNMDAWLKFHVAKILPVALALYTTCGDNYALAREWKTLKQIVRAMKEYFRVLESLDIPIEPSRLKAVEWLPESLVVILMSLILNTKKADVVIASHAVVARDEIMQLANELKILAQKTDVLTPVFDKLLEKGRPSLEKVYEECIYDVA